MYFNDPTMTRFTLWLGTNWMGHQRFSTALVTLLGFQCLCTATDAFHKLSHYPNLVIGQIPISAEQFQQDFKTESMHAAPTK